MLDGIVDMVQNIPEDNKPLVEQVMQTSSSDPFPRNMNPDINKEKAPEENPSIPFHIPILYYHSKDDRPNQEYNKKYNKKN